MITAKKELKIWDMRQDMKVWLPDDMIEILESTFQEKNPDIKSGLHIIKKLEDVKDNFSNAYFPSDLARPVMLVTIQRLGSHNVYVGSEILLAYNKDSHLIVVGGQALLENVIFRCFTKLRELQEANDNCWSCVSCNTKLNIISSSIRICKDCEDKLTGD